MSNTDLSIIIVDDLQFSRVVVKTALTKAGYSDIRMAGSASEALKLMEKQPAEVLLADWMMPEMDGLELTQRVRQRDEEKGIYTAIILFTAHEGVEYLVEAFDHGVDDYLCKPPNPQELAARVNAAARIATLQNDMLETSRQMQKTIRNLERMSLVDELTGAGNQKYLINKLNAHLLEASTRRGGVCLALVELRELESISASYGRLIANEIIVSQHRRLRQAARPTDVIARLDNNNFGIIMHHTNMQDYKTSAIERILTMIDNRAYKTSAGNMDISGCIGSHYYCGNETVISAEEMLKLASDKLTQARGDKLLHIAY
ncbi:MAG: response regulator [Gammaproteobacteria bacterium]|nr:response regulator [Gammaproteobacteria bacterium]